MRTRRASADQVADVARRRLELLSAELADLRADQPAAPVPLAGPTGTDANVGPVLDPVLDPPESGPAPIPASAPGRHARRPGGLLGGLVERVRQRWPGGGVGMAGSHLLLVALVLVVGVALSVWWVSRTGAGDEVVLPPTSPSPLVDVGQGVPGAATPPGPTAEPGAVAGVGGAPGSPGVSGGPGPSPGALVASPSGGAGGSSTGNVVVDVAGKVRRPGIATLPVGARVADALRAAGGARRGVALRSLNLARVLADGEQILVGVPAPTGVAVPAAGAPPSGATSGVTGGTGTPAVPMVDVNTADQVGLEQLPGVGPVTAVAILTYRSEHGGFTSVEELLEVSGIGEKTLADIAPHVTL